MQLNCYFRHSSSDGGMIQNWMRVMQLMAILMLVGSLSLCAAGNSQQITFTGTNVPLKTILGVIKKQTGYVTSSNANLFTIAQPVTIDAKKMPLKEFLTLVFQNQPITFSFDDKNIILERKPAADLSPRLSSFSSPPPPVTGVVRGPDGKPLARVNIVVKGTNKGTTSTADGKFSIEAIEGEILIVSSIGFSSKEITINNTNVALIITLNKNISQLDEVQYIAYGTTTKRLSTGNVSTVKAEEIARQPVNNSLLALAGRVPGLNITQANGLPGGGVNVQIQGLNSLSGTSDPFYVVDGVPFPAQNISNFGSILFPGNPLSFLNPTDIESIDVLKDADATSIYGSRAANGAILITTKKGQAGRTKVDLNIQSGFGQVAQKVDLLNTQQYLDMRKEAIANAGLTIPTTPTAKYYDLTLYDQNRYTDWQKELIGNTARYTDAHATISGGNTNTQILFSANYHKETDVFPGEFANKKGAIHLSFFNTSTDRKFQFRFTGNYMNDNNKLPAFDLTDYALKLIPNAPALYDNNGNINWEMYNGVSTWNNPLSVTLKKYNKEADNLVGNAEVSYELFTGLKLKTSFGYNKLQSDEITFSPQTSLSPNIPINLRSATYVSSDINSWIVEPQLNYQFDRNFGKFDLLAGSTFQRTNSEMLALGGSGYANDAQLENIMAASVITVVSSTIQSVYNYNALFGRINYNYDDRYLLNLNIRRDGSSRFGSANLFHNFYSAAGAWLFSNEQWFKTGLPMISYGKLKFSYGTSGSDQIGDYRFMSLYDNYTTDIPYGGGTGIKPSELNNPYLQWEETRKLNTGFDLGFFNDRLVINLNYYRNRSSNQLLVLTLPIVTGFYGITQNFDAKVQNAGFEFVLNSVNIRTKNLRWSSNFNFSLNRNKLVKYDGLESSYYSNTYIIGQPITITKAYQFAGVDPHTGIYQFKKADGTLTPSPVDPEDRSVIINTIPKYFGGFSNTFTFRGITLDFLLQFVKQTGKDPGRFGYVLPGYYSNSSAMYNQPLTVLNGWKQDGDISHIQQLTANYSPGGAALNFANSSDASFVDASFIRLKNISLSWSLPDVWTKKARLQNARLYFQGQNLLTITKFKGLDPETQGLSLPPLRVLTLGFQLIF